MLIYGAEYKCLSVTKWLQRLEILAWEQGDRGSKHTDDDMSYTLQRIIINIDTTEEGTLEV